MPDDNAARDALLQELRNFGLTSTDIEKVTTVFGNSAWRPQTVKRKLADRVTVERLYEELKSPITLKVSGESYEWEVLSAPLVLTYLCKR